VKQPDLRFKNVTPFAVLTINALALPLQTSLAPSPDEAFEKEQKKNQDRDKPSDGQRSEGDRERHEKHRFHIEDQKDDGIQIVLRMELNMGVADRFDSAFISRCLVGPGLWRLKKSPPQPRERQGDQRKSQCYTDENDNEQIWIRPHGAQSNSLGNRRCQVIVKAVNETATEFHGFAGPEKADREFCKELWDNERLQVLVDRSGFQRLS
jgi:hypothetical protein